MHPLQAYLHDLNEIRSTGAGVKETSFYPARTMDEPTVFGWWGCDYQDGKESGKRVKDKTASASTLAVAHNQPVKEVGHVTRRTYQSPLWRTIPAGRTPESKSLSL